MILQALCDYYRRQEEELPPPGFERKAIPFVIVLDRDGRFVDIEDTRDGNNKRDKGRLFVVPQGVKRTSGVAANLLWDGLGYVLGVVSETRAAKLDAAKLKKEQERTGEAHCAFIQRIRDIFPAPIGDEGVRAVLAFLERGDFRVVFAHPLWPELNRTTESLSFRLDGDLQLICQREAVRQAAMAAEQNTATTRNRCLVSGNLDVIARLHPAIKGVRGAQSSGANLFSFNFDAACSHGRVPNDRGMNAPVGEYAAFAYTTALNHLLRVDSRQRLPVGEDTFVFWAERPDPAERLFADWLQPDPDDPARGVEAIKALYEAPKTGVRPLDEDETRFFVLGLAPNNARLAVRLWNVNPVRELAANIRQHFDDLAIVRSPRDPEYLPLWRLLVATAAQGKSENIPSLLAGEVLHAILAGTHYPQILLVAALQRIRAEQGAVNYVRAALIKAVLVRNARFSPAKQEVDVSLDLQNPNVGYRLGRLFAVLERAQELASPGLNATIRDRFYGAASATPVTAFPYLLNKLAPHHLNKLTAGQKIWLENLIGQILETVTQFPPHLNLDDQGRFAIGYYHQRQAKKSSNNQPADQGAPDHD